MLIVRVASRVVVGAVVDVIADAAVEVLLTATVLVTPRKLVEATTELLDIVVVDVTVEVETTTEVVLVDDVLVNDVLMVAVLVRQTSRCGRMYSFTMLKSVTHAAWSTSDGALTISLPCSSRVFKPKVSILYSSVSCMGINSLLLPFL